MRILYLTLHRRWFDEIASGRKTEEYREKTPYWDKRLVGREYDAIHFRNGYNRGCPWMLVEWKGLKTGTWEGKEVHAIKLGAILEGSR